MSVKLLGFAAVAKVNDHAAFASAIRCELLATRDLLGTSMVALSSARTDSDLTFLRTCIELRIPTIVFLPSGESPLSEADPIKSKLRASLLSVSLATYLIPETPIVVPILEWADALLYASGNDENEILSDAIALGIPTRKLHPSSLVAEWTHLPRPESSAKHGFPTRRELLEFLNKRFAGCGGGLYPPYQDK